WTATITLTQLPGRNTTTLIPPTITGRTAGTPPFATGTRRGSARVIFWPLGSYRAIRTAPRRDRNGLNCRSGFHICESTSLTQSTPTREILNLGSGSSAGRTRFGGRMRETTRAIGCGRGHRVRLYDLQGEVSGRAGSRRRLLSAVQGNRSTTDRRLCVRHRRTPHPEPPPQQADPVRAMRGSNQFGSSADGG